MNMTLTMGSVQPYRELERVLSRKLTIAISVSDSVPLGRFGFARSNRFPGYCQGNGSSYPPA